MYQIERAIIMAAGMGKRFRPLTYSVPKPLIRVNGQPILESAISALKQNGITEIYIVVGYLKELFTGYAMEWSKKYNVSIELIENPYFESANNISTFFAAKEHFENAIIMEGDLLIHNPEILSPEFHGSEYSAYYVDHEDIDWMAEVDDNDRITRCVYPGDKPSGWQLKGISRWTSADGCRFRTLIEETFCKKAVDESGYGDDIVLIQHLNDFHIHIRRINRGDISEIDDIETLQTIDSNYRFDS